MNRCSKGSLPSVISSASPKGNKTLKPKQKCSVSNEFQAMLANLDEEGWNELPNHPKKRRLNLTQVNALEKHYEADNKLESGRKEKLALELGLKPRQVAVWFQNRRARCKNSQLENEYAVLKSSYEELKLSYEKFVREKEVLKAELWYLKLKLRDASESENLNNVFYNNEPREDYGQHQTWSCCSSSQVQLDCSALHLQENLSWFHCENEVTGAESGPADFGWFSFEVDY